MKDLWDGAKITKCFSCNEGCFLFGSFNTGILVNIETKGRVKIPKFWQPSEICDNPLCNWSKIQDEVSAHNLCNEKEA